MYKQQFRTSVLTSYGASPSETEELLAYNQNVFDRSNLAYPIQFPLTNEPHLTTWEQYATEAKVKGVFEALSSHLVQLQFPIKEGISQTKVYQGATRKGTSIEANPEATGLVLQQPESLQLIIHQSLAGAIPVLIAPNREDFVSLVQALTMRNEPKLIPASMGACMVAGFNNWHRVSQIRQQWEQQHPGNSDTASWNEEFGRLIPQKELYQDRFIILSNGGYSNVSGKDLGLSENDWQRISLTIRLEHECTHYFTRRMFGSMRNNLLDELIADYRGIVMACNYYRADWFLRFLGLESFPQYRLGGRLENYRGQPPLSERAFKILQMLVKAAAENLAQFEAQKLWQLQDYTAQSLMLMALTTLTIEELASSEASLILETALDEIQKLNANSIS